MRRYYRFSEYLRKRFGVRVYKVSIDAGFSCPNRDGSRSKHGCIYCDNRGFSFNSRIAPLPIEKQIAKGIEFGKRRFKAEKFIVYFQAYTNTYAPLEVLKKKYDTVREFKDVVGISIGTRPDCINEEILDLIESYTSDYEVWIEYGLQSVHNKTLEFINRGHLYEDFLEAVNLTRERKNIKICVHVIIGLPHETKGDILKTAEVLGRLRLDGIKIHPIHIIKGTKLEEIYKKGQYKPLELNAYVNLVVGFLERIWSETVIQRITADCPRELLVAPMWIVDKNKALGKIENKLLQMDTFQGRLLDTTYAECWMF
ncbi:TIGR01212 family radical SAM protein [bacterium]|nr:TIGR01212 family radical SAM protein [bacterium]